MKSLSIMIKPVSSACSMRCRYCFYTDVSEHREQYSMGCMSLTTLDNIVRKAFAYADETVSFAFQGGEPTLAGLEFYKYFVELVRKYNSRRINVEKAIQTNGYMIEDKLLRFLVEENFLIGISLDGYAELHDSMRVDKNGAGTFDEVMKTVTKLRSMGAKFNVLTVVNSRVAKYASECYTFLSKYGFLQFIPCIDPFDDTQSDFSLNAQDYGAFLKKTFDLYYKSFKNGNPVSVRNFDNYIRIIMGGQPENCGMCGVCAQYYLIEADGSVYPCDFYVLDCWKMGNICESSFFSLEKSPVAERFRQESLSGKDECQKCKWYGLCRGGCRRDREPVENGVPSLNKWCQSYKDFFSYAFSRMQEMSMEILMHR